MGTCEFRRREPFRDTEKWKISISSGTWLMKSMTNSLPSDDTQGTVSRNLTLLLLFHPLRPAWYMLTSSLIHWLQKRCLFSRYIGSHKLKLLFKTQSLLPKMSPQSHCYFHLSVPRNFLEEHGMQVSYPLLFKSHFMPLRFYERPTLIPVFNNWKKIQRQCLLLQKKARSEGSAQHCVAGSCTRRTAPSSEGRPPGSLPGNYSQCLSIKLPDLWTVSVTYLLYLDLFCASIS